MAHFTTYRIPGNAKKLAAKTKISLQPTQTDYSEFITGSVYSDQATTVKIEQSFDYPQDHENEERSLELAHWDVITTIKLKAKEGEGVQVFALAPYFRVTFENEAEIKEGEALRISLRAFERGRI